MPSIDPTILALLIAAFGGVGLKVVEHWLGKSKTRIEEAASFREEYRLQIASQKETIEQRDEQIKQIEEEVDKWRDKYYTVMDEFMTAKTEHAKKLNELQALLDEAKKSLETYRTNDS